MRTRYRRLLLAPILLLVAGVAFAGWWATRFVFSAYGPATEKPTLVEIPKGEGAARIYARLEDSGLVRSSLGTRIAHRLRLGDRPLKAGEYEFAGALTPEQVLRKIVEGRAREYPVTIREGLDRWEVVAEVAKALPWVDPDHLGEAIADPSPVADLDPKAKDLEGYLFPDTYSFTRGTEERDIVERMVRNFRARLAEATAKAGPLPEGKGVHELVVLASLVEAETGEPSERPRIAAVFANRLRIGMPLQCDPTVIYSLKRERLWSGDIRKADLRRDTPYNTYANPGLPPGPIGNPGLAALMAVLAPAKSRELYFVSKNDGTHVFSEDYETHRMAVQKWQREFWREKRAREAKEGATPAPPPAGETAPGGREPS